MQEGWECQKCHNVYAPNIPFCLYCWFNGSNNQTPPPMTQQEVKIVEPSQEILEERSQEAPQEEKKQQIIGNKNLTIAKVDIKIPVLNKNPDYPQSSNYPDTKIFLSGIGHAKERAIARKFKVPYILDSIIDLPVQPSRLVRQYYDYLKQNEIEYLLDSGAFSYMNNPKKSLDLDSHIKQYCYYINEFDIKNFFELDLDIFLPLEDVENIRKRIYMETHKKPIVVHHIERGHDYWVKTCKENDYVAMGGMASMQKQGGVDYEYFESLVDEAHLYGTQVHGLGCTPLSLLNTRTMFFDTVDSTSWNFNKRGFSAAINEKGELIKTDISPKFFSAIEGQEEDLRIWSIFCTNYKGGPRKRV